jgi:hypothetical protein
MDDDADRWGGALEEAGRQVEYEVWGGEHERCAD